MGHNTLTTEAAIALIGVAIAVPSALHTAALLYILSELRTVNRRLFKLEKS